MSIVLTLPMLIFACVHSAALRYSKCKLNLGAVAGSIMALGYIESLIILAARESPKWVHVP